MHSVRSVAIAGCVVGALFRVTTLHAQDVFVRAREDGQGVLLARDKECFVLTPRHVVGNSPSRINLIGERGRQTTAERTRDYPPDLTLFRVDPTSTLPCFAWNFTSATASYIDKVTQGTLRIREENGTRSHIPVMITNVGDQYLTVRPTASQDALRQGMSGGQLLVDNAIIGILLSVEDHEGIIFRGDELNRTLSSFFQTEPHRAVGPASSDLSAIPNCSSIGIVTYSNTFDGQDNTDAARVAEQLRELGYIPRPISQQEFRNQSSSYFTRFDLIVLTNSFTGAWDPSALVTSGIPVLLMNSGYVEKFGLGTQRTMHENMSAFDVVNNGHRITSQLPKGTLGIGPAIWTDAVNATAPGTQALLSAGAADKSVLAVSSRGPYVWFGWYRLSTALSDGPLFTLLARSIRWACAEATH